MEKKLAVIVDNNEEITTGAGNTEMCSCGTDVVMEMCSPESHDTCGDGMSSVTKQVKKYRNRLKIRDSKRFSDFGSLAESLFSCFDNSVIV